MNSSSQAGSNTNCTMAARCIAFFKQALDLVSASILLYALILFAGAATSGNAAGIPAEVVLAMDAAEAILPSGNTDG